MLTFELHQPRPGAPRTVEIDPAKVLDITLDETDAKGDRPGKPIAHVRLEDLTRITVRDPKRDVATKLVEARKAVEQPPVEQQPSMGPEGG